VELVSTAQEIIKATMEALNKLDRATMASQEDLTQIWNEVRIW
jgi:hypothetical protein